MCFGIQIFLILEHLHIHDEVSWGMGLKPKYEIHL